MNTKFLIQTLTEIPDIQLLQELEQNLKKTEAIIVPDLNKLFIMFKNLVKHHQKPMIFKSLLLIESVAKTLLMTEIQILWRQVGGQLVRLGGVEDIQIRKKGEQTIFFILNITKNSLVVLETLFYEGLESQNNLVIASSIQTLLKVFEGQTNILQKKSNISIIKLILQELVRLTFKDNKNLDTSARQFLQALFYLNFANMHEVLQRMDSAYLKALQKIWQKDKDKLIYKQNEEEHKLKSIQYEHLPLIRDKIFGVYEPFTIKNIFSYETIAANKFAVQQFKNQFVQNQQKLSKYINLITKIIIKVLPDRHIEILQLLAHILNMPGISNIISLGKLLDALMPQLADVSVPYRRLVRQCLQRLNSTAKNVLEFYNKKLNQFDRNTENYEWIYVCQLLNLVNHWVNISDSHDCYPPALNDALIFAFNKRTSKVPKVKQKCSDFLYNLLEKYPSYRQTLQDVLSNKQMGELQDQLYHKKNYIKLNLQYNKQAKSTFKQEYQEQRNRYIHQKMQE